jgi:hypothetical protein
MHVQWSDILGSIITPPSAGVFWWAVFKLLRKPGQFFGNWMTCAAILTVLTVAFEHDLLAALVSFGNGVIPLILWWLNRRRRKRSPKLAGAKSRARLAALVRKSREAAKPRPVLRPVPSGV